MVTKKARFIFTADWHVRETVPICRTDNYYRTQFKKIDYVSELQIRHGAVVLHAGDLFDHWKPSPSLLSELMKHIPDNFYTIYGNHDLPQHNLSLVNKSGVHTLEVAGKLTVCEGVHWGQVPEKSSEYASYHGYGKAILLWHVFTYLGKEPWPGCKAPKGTRILHRYSPFFHIIVTGDNHKTFFEEQDGKYWINPGSLMRMDADQYNHKPCVFLWYEDNTIEKHYIPIKNDVVSREHLDRKVQRENRIAAFISKLNTDWQATMSFEDNLKVFQEKNKVKDSVMQIIYKSLDL